MGLSLPVRTMGHFPSLGDSTMVEWLIQARPIRLSFLVICNWDTETLLALGSEGKRSVVSQGCAGYFFFTIEATFQ